MKTNNNLLLSKFANNKVLLFLIPNLLCFYRLFYYYNQNVNSMGTVLYYEVFIACLVFLLLNIGIYLFLKKVLRDHQKIFCVMSLLTFFLFTKMSLIPFLIFILFTLVLVIGIKKFIHFKLDTIIGIVSFITLILFSSSFLLSLYNVSYLVIKKKDYDYTMDFEVDKEKNTPNIYWIHCDGMMSQDVVNKYYHINVTFLETYFKRKNFYYNSNASLIAGHTTQRALVAMFNPYYYDNFYKNFLFDLEDTYLGKKKSTEFIVDYSELEEKRLHNELFHALKEQGYETVAIADYNIATSLFVDNYYDFLHYDLVMGFSSIEKEFRHIKDTNSEEKLFSYLRFNHIRSIFYRTLLYPLLEDVNYLDYDVIDYQDIDYSDYPYTRSTTYWFNQAIFKGIKDSFDKTEKQFTFIDYKLPHVPFIYDAFGNEIDQAYSYHSDYYLGHYIYSSNLLLELINYIQSFDNEAVIVVQGDHGIHTIEENILIENLNTDIEGVQEIRNSVMNAVYIPEKYRNGEEAALSNPLNISRYLVNNYVGKNYEYIE